MENLKKEKKILFNHSVGGTARTGPALLATVAFELIYICKNKNDKKGMASRFAGLVLHMPKTWSNSSVSSALQLVFCNGSIAPAEFSSGHRTDFGLRSAQDPGSGLTSQAHDFYPSDEPFRFNSCTVRIFSHTFPLVYLHPAPCNGNGRLRIL